MVRGFCELHGFGFRISGLGLFFSKFCSGFGRSMRTSFTWLLTGLQKCPELVPAERGVAFAQTLFHLCCKVTVP